MTTKGAVIPFDFKERLPMMKNKRKSMYILIFLIVGKVLLADILDFDIFNGSKQFINAKGRVIIYPDTLTYDDAIGTLYLCEDF